YSDRDSTFRDTDGIPPDSYGVELTLLNFQGQRDDARAAHLKSLLADSLVVAVRQVVEHLNHACECHGGGARRRILWHTQIGREHAGVEGGRRVDRLASVKKGACEALARHRSSPVLAVHLRLRHGL